MCNLSGYNGSVEPNVDKLKMLLLLGNTRGKDSVGIVINDHKTLGVGRHANGLGDSDDFLKNRSYPETEYYNHNTVLQHNRAKSSGAVNEKSVHPFMYGEDDENPEFIFMHNGTLENVHALAKKYSLDYNDFYVDSHLLGYIIWKHGFKVLEEYEGCAALAFYWTAEPEKLYLWKGASFRKKFYSSKELVWEEERPLHFVHTDNGGVYFSSLADHLRVIADKADDVIYTLKDSQLIEFVDGELVNSTIYDRSNIKEEIKTYTSKHSHNNYNKNSCQYFPPVKSRHNIYSSDTTNIIEPCPTEHGAGGKIYYRNGRYLRTGHIVDKVVCLDKEGNELNLGDMRGKLYHFYKGIWIKNSIIYNQINTGLTKFNISHIHPRSVYRDNTLDAMYLGEELKKCESAVYSDFMYFQYDYSRGFNRLKSYQKVYTDKVNTYNQLMGENLLTEKDCEAHYELIMSSDLNWEDLMLSMEGYYEEDDTSLNQFLTDADECKQFIDNMLSSPDETINKSHLKNAIKLLN